MENIKKHKLELKRILVDSKRQQENIKTIKKVLELKKNSYYKRFKEKCKMVGRKQGVYFAKYTREYYKKYEQPDFVDYLYDENRHADWYQTKIDFENGFWMFKNYKKKTEKNYIYVSEKGLKNIINYTKEYLEDVEQELYLNLSIIKEITEEDISAELEATKEQQERKKKKRIEKKKRFEEERKERQELIQRGYSEDIKGLKKYNKRLKKQQLILNELDEAVIEYNKEARLRGRVSKEEQTEIAFTFEERKLHTLTKYTFCKALKNVDNDIKDHVYMELYSINRMENYACLEGELPILQPVIETINEDEDDEFDSPVIDENPDNGDPILSDDLMEKINGYRPNLITLQMLQDLEENIANDENEEFKYQQNYIRDYPKLGKLFKNNINKDELNFQINMLAYNNSKIQNNFMYRLNEICFYKNNVPEILDLFEKVSKVVKERKEGEKQYQNKINELNSQLIKEYLIFDEVLKSHDTNIKYKKINFFIDFFMLLGSILVLKQIYKQLMPYIDPTFDLFLIIKIFIREINPVFLISKLRDYFHNIIYYEDAKQINTKVLKNEEIAQIIESGNPIGQILDYWKHYKIEKDIELYSITIINNILEISNKNNIGDFYDLYKDFLIAIIDFI